MESIKANLPMDDATLTGFIDLWFADSAAARLSLTEGRPIGPADDYFGVPHAFLSDACSHLISSI
jgi:hypothetical protein